MKTGWKGKGKKGHERSKGGKEVEKQTKGGNEGRE